MKKTLRLAAAFAIVASAAACQRRSHPATVGSAPRAAWNTDEVTVVEGRSVSLALTLSRKSETASVVDLSADADGQLAFPATVTFPAGSTSQSVTVKTLVVEGVPDRSPMLTASTPNGSSSVTIHVIDDDGDLGPASGPVTFASGVVVLNGPGVDGLWSTTDDELIAASGIGAGAPVITRLVVGTLASDVNSLPVVVGGSVLLLERVGSVATLVQVSGVPAAPAISASVTIPASALTLSKPYLIGAHAVLVSRGADGIASADDSLIVVSGIGGTTLTTKLVPLPGLANGDPSVPVELTSTALLITTTGVDFQFATGNEVLSVVTNLDATPVVTPIFTGAIRGDASGRAIASGGSVAAVSSWGGDTAFSTPDDVLQVVRDVLGTPTLALPIIIGPIAAGPEALPVAVPGDAVLVPATGGDFLSGNADDEVVLVRSLSTDPITAVVFPSPNPAPGAAGVAVVLSPGNAARIDRGADTLLGTEDDQVLLYFGMDGSSPASTTVVTGPLANFGPFVLDGTSLAFVSPGPDKAAGTEDDLNLRINDVGPSSALASFAEGPFDPQGPVALVPTASGHSFAGVTDGPDAIPATEDDQLSVTEIP